jgi:hypothetical protein
MHVPLLNQLGVSISTKILTVLVFNINANINHGGIYFYAIRQILLRNRFALLRKSRQKIRKGKGNETKTPTLQLGM